MVFRFFLVFISFHPTAHRSTIIAHRRCLPLALHRSALSNSFNHAFPVPSFFLLALSSFVHDSLMSSSSHQSNVSHPTPYRTACLQYSHLTHTPSPFCLLFTRPRSLCSRCPFLLAFLFRSGDIELNPGPVNFALCTLNIRFILHPHHSACCII